MSPQGKKIVGLTLILAPSLFVGLLTGLAIYKQGSQTFNFADYFSFDSFLLGILSSGATILTASITQVFIDKTAFSYSMQQFIRYFSLIGYLLLAPIAVTIEQVYSRNASVCWANVGLVIICISFVLTGIGFLKAGNKKS